MTPLAGISLTVIVKNEADRLAALLEAHRPLFTEAVVVDTGSTDESAARAAAAGARVFSFAWCDDFSAARNFALERARCPWTLVLDCDEAVAPQDFDRLRALATAPADRCYILPQWNYCREPIGSDWTLNDLAYRKMAAGTAGHVPAWSIRLFPNRDDVRYSYPVHECVGPSALQAALDVVKTDLPVHHYGHLQSEADRERRNMLYSKLLRRKLKENPEDVRTRYEMAVQLLTEQREDLARRLLDRTVADFPVHPETFVVRQALGNLLARSGDHAAAAVEFELALQSRPDWRSCWVDTARAYLRAGSTEKARRYVREGRQLFPADGQLAELEAQVLQRTDR